MNYCIKIKKTIYPLVACAGICIQQVFSMEDDGVIANFHYQVGIIPYKQEGGVLHFLVGYDQEKNLYCDFRDIVKKGRENNRFFEGKKMDWAVKTFNEKTFFLLPFPAYSVSIKKLLAIYTSRHDSFSLHQATKRLLTSRDLYWYHPTLKYNKNDMEYTLFFLQIPSDIDFSPKMLCQVREKIKYELSAAELSALQLEKKPLSFAWINYDDLSAVLKQDTGCFQKVPEVAAVVDQSNQPRAITLAADLVELLRNGKVVPEQDRANTNSTVAFDACIFN